MTQTNNTMTVAQTIFEQLGGNRFIAMTGSSHFTGSETHLNMKLTRNAVKASYLKIELTPADTYTMTFYKVDKMLEKTIKAEVTGVYADQLQKVFTSKTGLYTHM